MDNTLLPIGTIVKVENDKGETAQILIAGYAGGKSKDKIFDYIGFLYPYGFVSRDNVLLMNSSMIKEVLYKGYEDDDYKTTIMEVKKELDKARGETQHE
jgi:hypothetical protein